MKGFRTVLFNLLALILPALQVSGEDLGLTGDMAALYTTGIVFMNILLRMITTTPIGKDK